MKKRLALCCAALLATSAWAAKEMSVQVRDGQLRNRASFLGTVTGAVAYGDRVTVNQTQAGWCEVATAAGATGWIHESALTPKRVVMNSGAGDARIGASGEEVALAGKGFSAEVEAAYKKENQNIDYTWVDWMGQQKVSGEQIVQFLKQGNLAQ
jgi:uncharacterized protein YgiM (DUF1202 family)